MTVLRDLLRLAAWTVLAMVATVALMDVLT